MGRPVKVDHFDGAALPTPWGTASTPASYSAITYNGNETTITDEAGKVRKQTADALGRLTSVVEDPSGLNYSTSYTYVVGDNLWTVTQGSQTRTFLYDSLNRLYSAANPESGTMTYRYDANGNLIGKTDARNVQTTITVDF